MRIKSYVSIIPVTWVTRLQNLLNFFLSIDYVVTEQENHWVTPGLQDLKEENVTDCNRTILCLGYTLNI